MRPCSFTMSGKSFSIRAMNAALCFVVVVFLQYAPSVYCHAASNEHLNSTDVKAFLEYHFHIYFDANDPAQVAHAIELRNEIIANCVSKKIIAIPLEYHYDPENPVLECECYEIICLNVCGRIKNVLLFCGKIL